MTDLPTPPNATTISGLGECPKPTDRAVDVLNLDSRTYSRALDCVHCGLCLPACPTYTTNGLEADSPRGRIMLMKGLADGRIQPESSVVKHLDLCLDCRACETACPSGVVYHELIEETRERLEVKRSKTLADRFVELMFYQIFPHRTRVQLAMLPARLMQKVGLWKLITSPKMVSLLPRPLAKMQQMLPPDGPLWEPKLEAFYPAKGERKMRVGLLAGCVGSVLFQHVNRQTIELLQESGCDVIVPRKQGCCGALNHHGGMVEKAKHLARHNIDVFMSGVPGGPGGPGVPGVDWIVNNAAGCGAMLNDYEHLLRDDPVYAERAAEFVKRSCDITQLLVELDPKRPAKTMNVTATYHDACHLAHAQKVTAPPRQVLGWIEGLHLVTLFESDMCCGAAGTYNIAHPEMARDLAERKIRHIQKTGAKLCVTGNVGCAMQIQSEAARMGVELEVVHPVTLLHRAYFD